ncbi:MAG: tyrosine-type recombinase/integrase [Eubacterium sp.]|nr:tyrosine-type recombinase/integrase [Eubacterium sp.]
MSESYAKQLSKKQILELRSVLSDLPPYVKDFMRSIETTTQPRTRIGYAHDIKYFFEFLQSENPALKKKEMYEITCTDLDKLSARDIEEYMDYLSYYVRDGREYTNDNVSKKRKLVGIRTFFKYLYINDMISQNVTEKVKTPKIKEKTITRMEANETADFLDTVEFGNNLTDRQQKFHERDKTRDLALLTLMLSTGLRVSETVGLNIDDVDFDNSRVKVTRKGGNEAFVYFSDEATGYLQDYMKERKEIVAVDGHEDALFLSSHRKRITVRTVENMVKKYARVSTPLKKITPHKLRSTYGTALYQETGDIYLVADVLGHKDVNTTRKHYAELDQERKRGARNKVTLRESVSKDTSIAENYISNESDSE